MVFALVKKFQIKLSFDDFLITTLESNCKLMCNRVSLSEICPEARRFVQKICLELYLSSRKMLVFGLVFVFYHTLTLYKILEHALDHKYLSFWTQTLSFYPFYTLSFWQ